jgi:SAM-dependent methyltransferase
MNEPMRPLGLGNIHGSAAGPRGIAKRLEALGRLTPLSGDRLLDVGCASGEYTESLARGFASTDAIDIEPERLEVFDKRLADQGIAHRIVITQMSAGQMTFRGETFDAVTAIEVLEHIPDLAAALDEIHRVLRPGGRFLVTGPNRWFPFETHGVWFRGRRYPPTRAPFLTWIPPLHRRMANARSFTISSLRRTIEPHGFRLTGYTRLMPPFDRSRAGKRMRPITDRLERTPLGVFGITLVMVFERRTPPRRS